jgi:hypothetical protein
METNGVNAKGISWVIFEFLKENDDSGHWGHSFYIFIELCIRIRHRETNCESPSLQRSSGAITLVSRLSDTSLTVCYTFSRELDRREVLYVQRELSMVVIGTIIYRLHNLIQTFMKSLTLPYIYKTIKWKLWTSKFQVTISTNCWVLTRYIVGHKLASSLLFLCHVCSVSDEIILMWIWEA